MKKSELDELIETQVGDAAKAAFASPEMSQYMKDQLAEHLKASTDEVKAKMPPADPEVKKAQEETNKFKTTGEYLTAIYKARENRGYDERLSFINAKGTVEKTAGHMEIGDDSNGGFLVPDDFRAELLQIALEGSIVRPNATVIKMTTDNVKYPFIDDTSHASTVMGGVWSYWPGEATATTATKPKFGQLEMTPHKLMGITYASNEVLADNAIALEPLITDGFGRSIGYQEDDVFLTGSGRGQPLGIQNCNCVVAGYRNTTSHVYAEDLAEMYAHMLPSSLTSAVWVINPTVLPELIQLGSGNASAASGKNLIWINNAAEGPPMRIFGRPVIVSEKMQALGTAGDIGFYDFKYYLIGDRQPITIDVSPHTAFTTDETAWRFTLRVAGQCWPQSALTTRRGSTTVSPFVHIAATTS